MKLALPPYLSLRVAEEGKAAHHLWSRQHHLTSVTSHTRVVPTGCHYVVVAKLDQPHVLTAVMLVGLLGRSTLPLPPHAPPAFGNVKVAPAQQAPSGAGMQLGTGTCSWVGGGWPCPLTTARDTCPEPGLDSGWGSYVSRERQVLFSKAVFQSFLNLPLFTGGGEISVSSQEEILVHSHLLFCQGCLLDSQAAGKSRCP